MVNQEFDIVGIGNAIVDVITDVNDEFINQQELRKGLMSLVDLDTIKSLSNKIEIKLMSLEDQSQTLSLH